MYTQCCSRSFGSARGNATASCGTNGQCVLHCACTATAVMQVADLNALAELGKVYQDSLALSAQLRNLSSFRLQQDKVLGRGSLAVVQEGG